jgi:hypothetical protein
LPSVRAAAALAVLFATSVASGAAAPFDPRGVLLEGTEKHDVLGKAPVILHLGADGSAVAEVLDPFALANAWAGTWTFDGGVLEAVLPPVGGIGDVLTFSLAVKSNGAGKGSLVRSSEGGDGSTLKVKQTFPALKPRGWTTLVPHVRSVTAQDVSDHRSTVVLRRLDAPSPVAKKNKPLVLLLRPVTAEGLPGRTSSVSLLPGETLRLEGLQLPPPPLAAPAGPWSLVVTGPKTFSPSLVSITAVEVALRTPDPAHNGGVVGVRSVLALKKKQLSELDSVPLVAPWFQDDGGVGALPRRVDLVLMDLSRAMGLPARSAVRVRVLDPSGQEVASTEVALAPAGSTVVRPLDLLDAPGDLPGGVGQLRVEAVGGGGLPRGSVVAELVTTVTSSGVPVSSARLPVAAPERAGRTAFLAAPRVLAPQDGSASTRLVATWLGTSATTLDVTILDPDGVEVHTALVSANPGQAVSLDPASLGATLSLLPGGEAQVVVGSGSGLPVEHLVAMLEVRRDGSPDTLFPAAVHFEPGPSLAGVRRVHCPDLISTQGTDPGDRFAILALRNGDSSDLAVRVRAFDATGASVGLQNALLTLPAGAAPRLSFEELLSLTGVTLGVDLPEFRGGLVFEVDDADAPFTVDATQVFRSAGSTGGHSAPLVTN